MLCGGTGYWLLGSGCWLKKILWIRVFSSFCARFRTFAYTLEGVKCALGGVWRALGMVGYDLKCGGTTRVFLPRSSLRRYFSHRFH